MVACRRRSELGEARFKKEKSEERIEGGKCGFAFKCARSPGEIGRVFVSLLTMNDPLSVERGLYPAFSTGNPPHTA